MRPTPNYLAFALFSVLLGCSGAASAQIVFTNRTSTYNITFTDFSTFTDAAANYAINAAGKGTLPGDFATEDFDLKSLETGFNYHATGGLTISNVNLTGLPTVASFDVNSPNAGAGTVNLNYQTPVGANFNQSWVVNSVPGHTLEFQGGGTGFLNDGYPYTVDVTINGNWSSIGTGPGQTQFVGINSGWNISNFFTYNSGANSTTFLATSPSYVNGTGDANLDFILHGLQPSSTPEPGAMALLTSGLAVSAGFLRRKRR